MYLLFFKNKGGSEVISIFIEEWDDRLLMLVWSNYHLKCYLWIGEKSTLMG